IGCHCLGRIAALLVGRGEEEGCGDAENSLVRASEWRQDLDRFHRLALQQDALRQEQACLVRRGGTGVTGDELLEVAYRQCIVSALRRQSHLLELPGRLGSPRLPRGRSVDRGED